jgi:hypothetical protein
MGEKIFTRQIDDRISVPNGHHPGAKLCRITGHDHTSLIEPFFGAGRITG